MSRGECSSSTIRFCRPMSRSPTPSPAPIGNTARFRHRASRPRAGHRRSLPDIVLGAATGPIVAQVFLTAHTRTDRPALVSGLPGMGLPASGKGMNYRRLMDAFIAHSSAEVAAYTQASARSQVPCEVLLARLPMLRSEGIPQLQNSGPEAVPDTRLRPAGEGSGRASRP